MQTRKQLLQEVAALRARLGAAAGVTRKKLNERVARLATEVNELKAEQGRLRAELVQAQDTLQKVADALGTGERGAGLVDVARNAHTAEQELAALRTKETAHG